MDWRKYCKKLLSPRDFLIPYNFWDQMFTYNFEVLRGFNLLKLMQTERMVERYYYSNMIVIIMVGTP